MQPDSKPSASPDVPPDSRPAAASGSTTAYPYPLSAVSIATAALAGYELPLITQYAGPDIEHERRKLVRIGASVAIPAFLMLFTMFFFLAPYTTNVSTRIVAAFIASVFILVVDSIVVTTLGKRGGFGTLARIVISVCMGLVISEPILLTLYAKTISAHITAQLDAARTAEANKDREQLQELENHLQTLNQKMSQDGAHLQDYTSGNTVARHLKDTAAQRDQLIGNVRAAREKTADGLGAQKEALLKQRQDTQDAIKRKIIEMQQEARGSGDSGLAGKGQVYGHLAEELKALYTDLQKTDARVLAVEQQIDSTLGDHSEENAIESGFKLDLRNQDSAVAALSPAEAGERDRLQAEIAGYRSSATAIQHEQQQLGRELATLPEKYALPQHNDSLAQTQALYQILAENWFLRIKVAAIFLLLFALDVAPILIKLTVRTGYEAYLESLARTRQLEQAQARNAHIAKLLPLEDENNKHIANLCARAIEYLRAVKPEPADNRFIKSLLTTFGRVIDRNTSDGVEEATREAPVRKSFNPISLLLLAFKNTYWLGVRLFGGSHT